MATSQSEWHDVRYVHDLLSLCGHEEVQVCPACVKRDKDGCPHRGHEPAGPCKGYVFDEHDPNVHGRVNEHIIAHAERIALGRHNPAPEKELALASAK